MRIRTNSNTITIDGTVETPANKAVWKKDGQRAYDLAAKGLKASSKIDARALGIRFDAFMFSCSHKSLVKQALTGTGTAYKKMGEELQSKHPRQTASAGGPRVLLPRRAVAVSSPKSDSECPEGRAARRRTLRNLY